MVTKRTRHSPEFKAKVAMDAAKEVKTLNELASQYNLHSTQISQWKKELLEQIKDGFAPKKRRKADPTKKIDELYRQIGELTVERDWLKKKLMIYQ
jgi:transposase